MVMRLVEDEARAEALRGFLPPTPEPGCQAVEHFLTHAPAVGDLWVNEEGTSGIIVAGREAFVMGRPDERVGKLLARNRFYGSVCPAISTADPMPFLVREPRDVVERVVLQKQAEFDRPPLPPPLRVADVTPDLRTQVAQSRGQWVLSLWATPDEAIGAQCILQDDRLMAIGGARTLSSRFAEIAAWIDRPLAGRGLLANASEGLFTRYAERGTDITSLISTENLPALRYAEKVGWVEVGRERMANVGDPRDARPGVRVRWRA